MAAVPCTTPPADGAPGLYRGAGTVRGDGDGRLELPVWTRGFVWINGFGPGRLLGDRPAADAVRPGPELREGKNEM
ncbi:hypothetical protein [Streptomyces sp. NPDC004629]|uniref:hypothetical protein n=1 Tax=Streptomyces sp. NPDC004629 TaxID=3364705 RepID=UPI00368F1297